VLAVQLLRPWKGHQHQSCAANASNPLLLLLELLWLQPQHNYYIVMISWLIAHWHWHWHCVFRPVC